MVPAGCNSGSPLPIIFFVEQRRGLTRSQRNRLLGEALLTASRGFTQYDRAENVDQLGLVAGASNGDLRGRNTDIHQGYPDGRQGGRDVAQGDDVVETRDRDVP